MYICQYSNWSTVTNFKIFRHSFVISQKGRFYHSWATTITHLFVTTTYRLIVCVATLESWLFNAIDENHVTWKMENCIAKMIRKKVTYKVICSFIRFYSFSSSLAVRVLARVLRLYPHPQWWVVLAEGALHRLHRPQQARRWGISFGSGGTPQNSSALPSGIHICHYHNPWYNGKIPFSVVPPVLVGLPL